jgi:hypothetical protein
MKNLKTYQVFESETQKLTQKLTQKQIKWLDKCTKGTWKLNPRTGLIDVKGDFKCNDQGLTSLQGVRFGVVSGDFICFDNSLTSLEGAPQRVGRGFYCRNNSLTSLKGAPQEVGGRFSCYENSLTSLEGAPQEVGGDFDCSSNLLTSLEGAPQEVGGDFECYNNSLTSLEGAPLKVGRYFKRSDNPVPEEVLQECYKLMKQGKTYSEAVQEVWEELDQDTKVLMYRPSFGWLSPEEHKKWVSLQKYQQIKNII